MLQSEKIEKYKKIIHNQRFFIKSIIKKLRLAYSQKKIEADCTDIVQFISTPLPSNNEITSYRELIHLQSICIKSLLETLEDIYSKIGIKPFYEEIPLSQVTLSSLKEEDKEEFNALTSYKNILLSKKEGKELDCLSFKEMIQLGTWGRYSVLLKDEENTITPDNNKYIYILHCNFHENAEDLSHRNFITKQFIKHSQKIIEETDIKGIKIISTNEHYTSEDINYVHNIHHSFEHWSPYWTAQYMRNEYKKHPKSYVITNNYIKSLLLDNKLFFKINPRLIIKNLDFILYAIYDIIAYERELKNKMLIKKS